MKSRLFYGSPGIADFEQAAPLIEKLRLHLSNHLWSRVFNLDKTAIFFKLLPRYTYTLVNENTEQIQGMESMEAEDRVTV